MGSKHIIIPL